MEDKMRYGIAAVVAAGLAMIVSPGTAAAQQTGTAAPAAASPASCAQNAASVVTSVDQVNARVEQARQLNDPARLRAAVSDVALALAEMKAGLAACVALGAAGSMESMPGMDHSKMNMPGMDHSTMAMPAAGASPAAAAAAQTGDLSITLTSRPSPARAGDDTFEVVVKDKSGAAVSDATVSLAFYMPPIPNMGAMRSTATLATAGNGVYRGEATVGMPGEWDVTITVSRGQQQLGSKTIKLTAQ